MSCSPRRDGRGYTVGIIGFRSGTGDLLDEFGPQNPLARRHLPHVVKPPYLP
ncbi:chitosanase [Amycolatopsis sp. cmx-11-51]|uniref:chitosanase n=1 Tax=unclassified Amycolatopsis TaxID=2618356 RepID=UPI0039E65532